MKLPFILLLLCLFIWTAEFSSAQSNHIAKADSNSTAILPGVGYDSDGGFAFGALFQRITYHPDWNPYRKLFRLQGGVTSKGNFAIKSEFERRFSSQARLNITVFGERVESAYFFGIGQNSSFNSTLWDDKYYDYSRWYGLIQSEVAIPLTSIDSPKDFWLIQADIQYFSPDSKEGSLYFEQPPSARIDGWSNRFGGGFYSDNRDDPFRTKEGYQLKVTSTIAPAFLGNENYYGQIKATGSYYTSFHLIKEITFAGRIRYWQAIGDAPFFDLPFIGGQYDLRGFPFERFRDKGVLNYNLELRTWLFKLPFWNIEAGGQLFFDAGWVFDNPSQFQAQNMKWNAGFGGISSVFRSDFLIRADVGFSPEIWRLSIGLGYLF